MKMLPWSLAIYLLASTSVMAQVSLPRPQSHDPAIREYAHEAAIWVNDIRISNLAYSCEVRFVTWFKMIKARLDYEMASEGLRLANVSDDKPAFHSYELLVHSFIEQNHSPDTNERNCARLKGDLSGAVSALNNYRDSGVLHYD